MVEDTLTNHINIYDSLRQAGRELKSNHVSMLNYLDKAKLYRDRYCITLVK